MNLKTILYTSIGVISLATSFTVFGQNTSNQSDLGDEIGEAVTWMHTNKLTKYDNVNDFLPRNALSRQEAAKFFGEFANYLDKEYVKTEEECVFSDLDNADYTLTPHIQNACMLGLFQGSGGKYMPFANITRAEAMTVISRTLSGFKDENIEPWRREYHKHLREEGITDENNAYSLNTPISRYEAGIMLYRAGGETVKEQTPIETNAQLDELKELLLSLGMFSS